MRLAIVLLGLLGLSCVVCNRLFAEWAADSKPLPRVRRKTSVIFYRVSYVVVGLWLALAGLAAVIDVLKHGKDLLE